MLIRITIVSTIAVLVSYSVVIWFGYFMSMSHCVNKNSSQVPPTTSLLSTSFHQVCLLFYKKYFFNLVLLWSDYLQKIICLLSTHYLSGLILVFCLHKFFTAFFTVLPWWNYESIISRLHGYRFNLSLTHLR